MDHLKKYRFQQYLYCCMRILFRKNMFTEPFPSSGSLFLLIKMCFLAENAVSCFVSRSLPRSGSMHHNIYKKGVLSSVHDPLFCNIHRSCAERQQICVIYIFNTQHKSELYLLFGYKLYWYNLRNRSDFISNLGVQILRKKKQGHNFINLFLFLRWLNTAEKKHSSDTANTKAHTQTRSWVSFMPSPSSELT
jgi:hypothetical protein